MMKPIVIAYYSRTGVTRKVAGQLAALLDADLEEIREAKAAPACSDG
ncbi:MAG: flavodoxin [Thermoguttaceae bacterium]